MPEQDLMNLYFGDATKNKPVQASKTPDIMDMYFNDANAAQEARDAAAERTQKKYKSKDTGVLNRAVEGAIRGGKDVVDTLAEGLATGTSYLADNYTNPAVAAKIKKSKDDAIQADVESRDQFNKELGNSRAASLSRVGGQIAATAPLLPERLMIGAAGAVRALPTVGSGAAPLTNRLIAGAAKGAIAGGEFGALTNSANDRGLLENVTEGAGSGAVGGPIFTSAGIAGRAILDKAWNEIGAGTIARSQGLPYTAVKNIIERLKEAGMSPQQAEAELQRLGPKATLADIDPSLTTEASGLASTGGTPTALLKGRFDARADQANQNAVNLFNQKLGGKPDLDLERESVKQNATTLTSPDYQAAYQSGDNLNISHVVDDIDKQLETAVGQKSKLLKQVKGWLYGTDQNGEKYLKTDIPSLHEIRQALDDVIKDKNPVTSAGRNALRSVSNIRNQIDNELKTNPEMQAADEKFAERMKVLDGFDIGEQALNGKINFEQFHRMWTSASPEMQETIKKGFRAKIGDLLDKGSQGELTQAQRMFGKKSINRNMLKLAFGSDADEVLDELTKMSTFKATERAVTQGSQTAERRAVQERYNAQESPGGIIGDTLTGIVGDVVHGSPGLLTTTAAVRRAGSGGLARLTNFNIDNLKSGSADILSRGVAEGRDTAVDVLKRVNSVQNRIRRPSPNSLLRLPTTLPSAINNLHSTGNSPE